MMKKSRLYKAGWTAFLLFSLSGLASCAGEGETIGSGGFASVPAWSNYKCFAMSGQGGERYTGWSPRKGQAEAIALSKCRSRQGRGCRVVECRGES